MPPSRLDGLYRSLLLNKFFCKGWGKPENLRRLFEFRKIISDREKCLSLVPKDYPVEITKEEVTSDCKILEGKFMSPLEVHLPGLVPEIAQDAHFQILLPLKWNDENYKPICIHLAGTGDHYFWRRRNFIAKPLMKEANLGAILLENPFYGLRKPKEQKASSLHNVSDIFVMGGCLVLESLVLLNWCERNGYGPLGITGLSMGGHMASLAATNWPKPLVLVPCLSWSTASAVFTQGVMSQSIHWDVLETQYFADGNYRERLSKMVTIVDDTFLAGQKFIQHFNESMSELKKDLSDIHETKTSEENMQVEENVNANMNEMEIPQGKVLKVNGNSNILNLSAPLLAKLLSKEKSEFTQDEINELNIKIKIALKKYNHTDETESNDRNNNNSNLNDSDISIQTDKTVTTAVVSENTGSSITSALNVSGTKLMSYMASKLSLGSSEGTSTTAIVPSPPKREKLDPMNVNWWEHEALQFMRGVMDECTHLKNFTVPYDTSLIIAVCAKDDAYIPRDGCISLEEIWPGAEIRYLDAGHVSAYVLHQKLFRSSIIEAFERSKLKWEPYVTAQKNKEYLEKFIKQDEEVQG